LERRLECPGANKTSAVTTHSAAGADGLLSAKRTSSDPHRNALKRKFKRKEKTKRSTHDHFSPARNLGTTAQRAEGVSRVTPKAKEKHVTLLCLTEPGALQKQLQRAEGLQEPIRAI